jgi:hypothetical protein
VVERYDLRKDSAGWAVFDVWTGQTVVIAGRRQGALTLNHACELMLLLNAQARRGSRVVLQ